jgi:hypothetical protein
MKVHARLALGVLLVGGTAAAGWSATIFSSFNTIWQPIVADNRGRPSTVGGTFDLHAGAQVVGALPVATQVFHTPAQPGLAAFPGFFPTQQGAMAAKEVGADKRMQLDGGGGRWVAPPVPYVQSPKDFERGIPFTTQTAFRRATDAAGVVQTNAEAVAKAQFTLAGATATVNPAGSYSSLDCVKLAGGNCSLRDKEAAPNGAAGSLVRDPMSYTNIGPDALASSIFSLSQSDFRVQNTDNSGMAVMEFELGTDAFGIDPGSLGLDTDGNPMLLQMQMAFLPDGTAWLSMEFDASFSDQQFFDPQNGNAPITGNLEDFVANRMNDAMQYDPAAGQWTLKGDVSLFGESFAIPSGETSMQLDYTTLQMVSHNAPEPGTVGLGLVSLGALGVAGWLRRRERTS